MCALLILGGLALFVPADPSRNFAIPEAVLVSGNSSVPTATFNTLYAYPIELDGVDCFPDVLSLCITDFDARRNEDCCKSLYDESVYPRQIIPDDLLMILSLLIPIILLCLRALVWRFSWRYAPELGEIPSDKVCVYVD